MAKAASTAVDVIGYLCFFFGLCLCLPTLAYYLFQVYKYHRHNPIIIKRYFSPHCIVLNVSVMVIVVSYVIISTVDRYNHNSNTIMVTHCLINYISIPAALCLTYFGVARFYALYFDVQFSVASSELKWSQYINESHSKANFYLRHKNTLGHPQWVVYRIVLPLLCADIAIRCILLPSLMLRSCAVCFQIWNVLSILIPTILTAICIAIWWRIPKYHDQFRVKDQIKNELWCWGAFLLYVVIHLSLYAFHIVPTTNRLIWIAMLWAFLICSTVGTLQTTYWPIHRSGLFDTSLSNKERRLVSNISVDSPAIPPMTLIQVLQHKLGFEALIAHVISEFSIENMLGVLEITQLQQWCIDNLDGISYEKRFKLELPNDLPQSSIIFGSDEPQLSDKVFAIIDKYIREGSVLQLNLPYSLRSGLENIKRMGFDNVSDLQLAHCFDEVIDAVVRLMIDSYTRWKRKPEYDKIQSLLQQPMTPAKQQA